MATPTIALRFRDTTPGVDTIEAHREIISEHGAVWWGWWKKQVEEIDLLTVSQKLQGATELLLVNRASRRAYIAAFEKFSGIRGVEKKLVPAYYKNHLEEITGFFYLTGIDEISYDPKLGENFGERTILWLGGQASKAGPQAAITAEAGERNCVLHLSDLHFGSDYGFRVQREKLAIGDNRWTMTASLVADLERLGLKDKMAAIVVSGDFMSKGDWNDRARAAALEEFEVLRRELSITKSQVIAVPGNHDIVRYPDDKKIDLAEITVGNQTSYQHEREFRTFIDELIDRNWRESLNYVTRIRLHEVDLLLCVINSCTITATQWTEYGFAGPNGLDALRRLKSEESVRPTFRFLALHHHLLPVADVEAPQSRGVTLALDASEILFHAQKAGVDVVLHGHQHKPKISVYQDLPLMQEPLGRPIHVIANGSAGAKHERLPHGERNTYCLFRLNPEGAELWMRELRLDGRPGAELFRGSIPIRPTTYGASKPHESLSV